jgi:hypothetical protein
MDKSRYKRPPDVNEALSSMLWTPYDQTTAVVQSSASSSSTDSLSDDERERERRKFNRHSNPLPSSLNWWNSHVANVHQHPQSSSLRYSFPFYGNCVPSISNNSGGVGVSESNRSAAGQTHINTSSTTNTTTTMVHSFTDDFYQYQYQVIKIPRRRPLT